MTTETETGKSISPVQEFRTTVDRLGDQFLAALPQHISVEKFKRTVVTAVTMNPDLLEADRRSLLASCMKAASDGLLLDGRDAALVKFFNKKTGVSEVQYMPMIGGILKRMRQSGDIKSVCSDVVHAGDEFDYWTDENGKHLTHRPAKSVRGDITHAYAIINTVDSGVYIEVMDFDQVEKVRAVSRAKDSGPWSQWWDQMARKTVLRRLSKSAPMSTELADLLQRDDALVEFSQVSDIRPPKPTPGRPRALAAIAGETAVDGAPAVDEAPAPAATGTDGSVF